MVSKIIQLVRQRKTACFFTVLWLVLDIFSYMIVYWDWEDGLFNGRALSAEERFLNGDPKLLIFALLFFLFGTAVIWLLEFKKLPLSVLVPCMILGFGFLYIFFSPILNGMDEGPHLFKTIATLDGKLLDYESYTYPISDSYLMIAGHPTLSWRDPFFSAPWAQTRTMVDGLTNGYLQCTYPPYGYLFCVIGCGLGILFRASAGTVVFLGRLFNLFGYVLMVSLSLRIVPKTYQNVKRAIAFAACIPGLIFTASMITQDGMIFGFSILLIALAFRMREEKKLSLLIAFSILFLMLIPLRYPFIILGFLLLLVPKEHYPKAKKALFIIALAAAAVVTAMFYFFVISEQFAEIRVAGTDTKKQILYVITHLPYFIMQSVSSFMLDKPWSKMLFLGNSFGYYISYMMLYTFSYAALFFITLIIPNGETGLKKNERLLIGAILAAAILLVYFALYCTYNTVGWDRMVLGVQGRYFFPMFALLPLVMKKQPLLSEDVHRRAESAQLLQFFMILWNLFGFCAMFIYI